MPAKSLKVSLRHQPGIAVMDLEGEINASSEGALGAAMVEVGQREPRTLILNFSDVDYINSTGIALIVGLLGKARNAGCGMLAYGLSAHYVEIFRITRLADYLSILPDEASALAEARRV